MKKLLSLVVVLILAISGAAMAETETKTYVIGATPSPHAELLELIKDDMAELGYPIEKNREGMQKYIHKKIYNHKKELVGYTVPEFTLHKA